MLVYRFKPAERADTRVALTADEAGGDLPADGAPWQPIGRFDLAATDPWIKAPRAEIEAALRDRGYFVWRIGVPKPAPRFARPSGEGQPAGKQPV